MYNSKKKFRREISNFTLIELLLIIAIITILVGMLLTSLNQVRNRARSIQCVSQLNQIGKTLQMYMDDYSYTPSAISNNTYYWWWVPAVYLKYVPAKTSFEATNALQPLLRCPADTTKKSDGTWGPNYGYNGIYSDDDSRSDEGAGRRKAGRIRQPSMIFQTMDSGSNGDFSLGSTYRISRTMISLSLIASAAQRHLGSVKAQFIDGHVGSFKQTRIIYEYNLGDNSVFFDKKQTF